MFMKIGELAKHTGLTVRTLHHYHDIGLLLPSIRTDAGYRLYACDDVARLHKIQALKQFGFALADIGNLLAGDGTTLPDIIAQQLQNLAQQMAQAERLQRQLQTLQTQIGQGQQPSLTDWLNTLEMMTMYDKYFTPAELAELEQNKANANTDLETAWPPLVAAVRKLMVEGIAPEHPDMQALTRQWLELVDAMVGNNANLLLKLDSMTRQEPGVQAQSGIDTALLAYLDTSRASLQYATFARFLDQDQLQVLMRQRAEHGPKWPALIGAVRQAMNNGAAQDDPEVLALARQWQALGEAMAGGDPQIQTGLLRAFQEEPQLMRATGMDQGLLDFIQPVVARLRAASL